MSSNKNQLYPRRNWNSWKVYGYRGNTHSWQDDEIDRITALTKTYKMMEWETSASLGIILFQNPKLQNVILKKNK